MATTTRDVPETKKGELARTRRGEANVGDDMDREPWIVMEWLRSSEIEMKSARAT